MAGNGHNRGRAVSWLAVVVILAGFTLGGLALILDLWWLFWVSVGIVVVGGIFAIAIDIFADVQLDPLHQDEAEPHVSPIRHEVAETGPERLTTTTFGPDADGTDLVDDAGAHAERDESTASP